MGRGVGRSGHPGRREACGVDHEVAGLVQRARSRLEPARDGVLSLRIVALTEILPDPAPPLAAEPLWSIARNCERRTSSPPPAPNSAPTRPPSARRSCASRAAAAARPSGVRVDPGDVGVDQADRLPTLLAPRTKQVELLREARLGRGARTEGAPESANAKASIPGTSSAAMRPGPRRSSIDPRRSAAVAQPAPKATSSAVRPFTCGTPQRSRLIVTPARGRSIRTRLPRTEAERLALEEAPEVDVPHAVAPKA